ncbi:unnamed protein product, partial [Laminaria digitata]
SPQAAATATSTAAVAVVYGLSEALKMAQSGDTVLLGDGEYHERLKSSRDGQEGNPITIVGGVNAVIKASSDAIKINHSWITIQVSEN